MHSPTYIHLMNSKRWRLLRAEQLAAQPLCQQCKQEGRIRAAQCVHHITPVETARTDQEAEQLCYSTSNLMSLCYLCHAEIHRQQRSHSKAIHRQRADQALQRWINQHQPKAQPR